MRRGLALLAALLENETRKVLARRRFRIVLCVLAAVLGVVVFGQYRQQRSERRERGAVDWRPAVEKRAFEMERRSGGQRIPPAFARYLRFESARLKYHLERGIDPDARTGPAFARGFAGIGSVLLLPLLVSVVASDLVSSEFAEGTVKLLLTRPVARWKVLLSKFLAMGLFTTLTLLAAAFLSWGIAGLAFGWQGWGAPMLTGFRFEGGQLDAASVRTLPLWQDTVVAYGLAYLSALSVGCITMLLSVVFRAAAAAMGTMMATLIAGTILSRLASDWDAARYFFVTCLPLPDYHAGMPTPFPDMSLGFCATVLAAWALAAAALAFALFVRRDVAA